jgi:Holliday junction resolvase RusA-like endonuclease
VQRFELKYEFDLPFPPSANRLWRQGAWGKRPMRSREYLEWIKLADRFLYLQMPRLKSYKTLTNFAFTMILRRQRHSQRDIDNCAKAVLDFCQRSRFIADDRECAMLALYWDTTQGKPEMRGWFLPDAGCRVILAGEPA